MAGFMKKIFGKKKPEQKLDLVTVRQRKTLTPEEQDLYRQEAEKARVPPLPSRGRSYKRRSIKGREKVRQARGKAALSLQARFRGNKSRQNTRRLRKHRDTMQPKLAEIEYDNYEDDEDDEYDRRPPIPPPPPSSSPSVTTLRRKFENNQGGRRTRKRRRKRRRKTKRKGRRKTKKRRKRRKRKTRRKR